MNCKLYDHAVLSARPLLLTRPPKAAQLEDAGPSTLEDAASMPPSAAEESTVTFPTTVFGPTCDGLDVVLQSIPLPELEMGTGCSSLPWAHILPLQAPASMASPPQT